jgi:3-phenylpropionate/trans-cinnamate dioxygenase ferredoxin subunit
MSHTWHKIADTIMEIDFAANNIAVVQVNGKKICIGKFGERLSAFAFKCPHAGGIMADGYIDAMGNVVCPLHRYKYDMKNGRNVSGEGYYLKNWPMELREDGVYVGMEKGGLCGWL